MPVTVSWTRRTLPNLIVTPHVAYYSEESLLNLDQLAAENVAAVLSGRRPVFVASPAVLAVKYWSHPSERR